MRRIWEGARADGKAASFRRGEQRLDLVHQRIGLAVGAQIAKPSVVACSQRFAAVGRLAAML